MKVISGVYQGVTTIQLDDLVRGDLLIFKRQGAYI